MTTEQVELVVAALKKLPCRAMGDPELDELRLREAARAAITALQASPALPSEEMRTELLELLELGGDYAAEVFNEFPNKTSPCALEVKRNITRFNAIYTAMQLAAIQ